MRTVSHYEMIEKLGEGGMGVVWKGRDTRLDRLVAIKFLQPEKTADVERKRRFAQEARSASALNHPRIITIYDIDHADGADFIVMEYLAGKTLEQLIPSKGMKVAEALRVAIQIADALAAAHAAGIIHRDLKPANVMVSDAGQVKVLDFGLAKLQEPTGASEADNTRTIAQEAKTEDGTIVGTTSYMSPEQAEGKKVDARSDIFSFGAVLYEMLTGKRAFRGDSKMSTLAAVLRSEPDPMEKTVEGVPRELIRIVQRCLRKDPDDRAQSMADLRVALKDIQEESESGQLAAAPVAARKSGAKLWIAVGLAAIAAVLGAAYLFRPAAKAPEVPLQAALLTSYPGREGSPTFSPDGNQVAFIWDGEQQDNFDIYVKLLGSGKPLRLTSDPAREHSPAWSPDGRWIAFIRSNSLMVIPPIGGAEREVAQGNFGSALSPGTFEEAGGITGVLSWSPDGRWLVVTMRENPKVPQAIYLISMESGEKRRLTTPPQGTNGDYWGAISPDGRTLAFARLLLVGTRAMSDGDLYVLPLRDGYIPNGQPKQITGSHAGTAGLAWTADSREILFSWFRSGSPALWRLAASGSQKPVKLTVGDTGTFPAISRQGNRLAFENLVAADTNIWRVDLSDPSQPPKLLISSTRADQSPNYSPDGKKVVFSSERSGLSAIWVCDADGGNAMQITETGASGSPAWSPDGQRVAFDTVIDGKWQIATVNGRGGKIQLLTSGDASHSRPSWSRDGQWIFSTGGGGLQKIPVAGGAPVQLAKAGGTNPLESPDGKTIYYQINGTIWRIGTDGSDDREAIDGPAAPSYFGISADGIYYNSPALPGALQFFSFATGHSRPLLQHEKRWGLGMTISPDRKWLLYTQVDTKAAGDLMLVDPFR